MLTMVIFGSDNHCHNPTISILCGFQISSLEYIQLSKYIQQHMLGECKKPTRVRSVFLKGSRWFVKNLKQNTKPATQLLPFQQSIMRR